MDCQDEEYAIATLTLDELKQYTIGEPNPVSDYASKFPDLVSVGDQKIPTLREVIALAKEKSDTFQLVIEIKTDIFDDNTKSWKALVDEVMKVVTEEDFMHRTLLCGFDWEALIYAKNLYPQIQTWFTVFPFSWYGNGIVPSSDIPPSQNYLAQFRDFYSKHKIDWYREDGTIDMDTIISDAKGKGANALFCYYSDCTQDIITQVHSKNMEIMAWSVNLRDKAALQTIHNSDIDGLCTDYP